MKKSLLVLFPIVSLFADINLESLVSKVLNNNPSIKMYNKSMESATKSVEGAMWQYYPTPSIDISRSNNGTQSIARLEQPLWTGGKLDASYNQALSNKQEISFSLEERKYKFIELILNYSQSYMQSEYTKKALNSGLDRLNNFTEMVDRKIRMGLSPNSDKRLLESRITQIKSDLINSEHRQKTALKQLSILVGEDITDINFPDIISFEGLMEGDLEANVVQFNPTLNVLEQKVKTAIYEIDKQEASLYPTLGITAEHRRGSLYSDNDSSDSNNIIYLSLKTQFGAGLSSLTNIEQARIEVQKLEFERKDIINELIDQFWIDYNNLLVSKNKIENYEVNKKIANDVFESNKRLFLADKKQWLDLVNSSREVMDIDISLEESKVIHIFSKYRVALRTGFINLDTGKYIN